MTDKKAYTYLTIIILLQLSLLIYYMNKKVGFHIDELWSYSLSNSINSRPIFTYIHGNQELKLYNRWIKGEYFNNLLTIQPDERFNYKKVRENQIYDGSHPPLYYYIFNTICSFFPNSFSIWYGFSINIIAFVFTQILLYKISKKLFNNKIALLCTFFYGFSAADINTFIFIRMYALLTFFFLLITYIYLNAFETNNYRLTFFYVLLSVFLGSFTQYHFIVYAFYITIVFDVICLNKKKYDNFWYISLGALSGISLLFYIWPEFLIHLTSGQRSEEAFNYFTPTTFIIFWQNEFFSYILSSLFGINNDLSNNLSPILNLFFLLFYIIVLITLLVFIYKKNAFIYGKNNSYALLKKIYYRLKHIWINNYKILFILISVYLFVVTIAPTINYPLMQKYALRYFFPVLPFIASFILIALIYIFRFKILNKYRYTAIISLIIIFCLSGQYYNLFFLFPNYENGIKTNKLEFFELTKNSNCYTRIINDDYICDLSVFLKNSNKCIFFNDNNKFFQYLKKNNERNRNLLITNHSFYLPFIKNIYRNEFKIEFKHLGTITNMYNYEVFEIKQLE